MRNDNMQTFTVEDYSLNPVIVHKNNIISKNVLDENIYGLRSVDSELPPKLTLNKLALIGEAEKSP